MKPRFKRLVDSGDIEGVRISLSNEMILDPRGDSFKEMQAYAEAVLQNLYDSHNGAVLDSNQNNWNRELLNSTKNALDENFSKERLEFFYNLARVVLKDKANALEQGAHTTHISTRNTENESRAAISTPSVCLTAGGVIIGGIGLIFSKPVVTTIGIAGIIAGVYKMYNDNHK